jgi:hypothetical protein
MDRWKHACTGACKYRVRDGWMEEWMYVCLDGCVYGMEGRMDG